LSQFFRAARARDNNSLAMMSAVVLDPREQGEVTDFDITSVSEERRTPLDFKALHAAEQQAKAADDEFKKRKIEYQNANMASLEQIVKLERDPAAVAKFTPAQQKMKAEWDKWREDTARHQKALTAARAAMKASSGPAEASLAQPGQAAFDASKFVGNLVSKDVIVDAEMRTPDGQTARKTLTVTIQRVEGTLDGVQRTGKPIITRIQGT
jgi:PIN domain nuclease of toxin-antitoxin system